MRVANGPAPQLSSRGGFPLRRDNGVSVVASCRRDETDPNRPTDPDLRKARHLGTLVRPRLGRLPAYTAGGTELMQTCRVGRARGSHPYAGENVRDFAKRLMGGKYRRGNCNRDSPE